MRYEIRNTLLNITNTILLVISAFLIARILFRLLGANTATPFISWIYDISAYLMTPFSGIFNSLNLGANSVLDMPALFTLIAYSLIGILLVYLIRTLTARLSYKDELEVEESNTHQHSHARAQAHTH